ncbi:ribose 5-phosphate isomerase B [Pedobacter changchengzhani]|uniref:Ribose 5-phosphate isomerase B n=1 Tax=Pedobacter changchengzhani TaxID=2529274 RepID=A0A4R5MPQ4_9SPHI|nr:ribose 5-phosphate isomerase B [Pedobacter changchengzhani]TDG37791.1 ribose 5-phosphate isomerase B [Pedobacter changchengzhani]
MPNTKIKIAIGSDHAGFEYKEALKAYLTEFDLQDFGTHSIDSVDYPDFAHPVALAVENKEFDYGILICGTANGVAMTANKHQHIRAAICWENDIALLVRKHNDANILCIPARFVSEYVAKEIATTFLTTDFEGGRHQNRIDKMSC